jgi:L-fuconolactonase
LAGRAALLGIARRFRDIPILVDHVGVAHASTPELRYAAAQGMQYLVPPPPGFGIEDSLAPFGDLEHVHFKVTDINFDRLEDARFDSAAFVLALASRFGANRLLWGSDVGQSPAPYPEKLERLRASARLLDAEQRAAYFGGTAWRLYGKALG